MLLTISTLLVLIYTSVCLLKVYLNRKTLVNMTGMMAVMIIGMASSTALGLIAGIVFKGDLTLSTITAMSFALIIGFLAGKPISLLAMAEGIAAGIMGGMMGAMLGEMLPLNNFNLMLVFIDILFIISALFISHFINSELKKDQENSVSYPLSYPWIITSILSAIIIFTFAHLETKSVESNNQVDEIQEHHHHG
ncbi:hypothetical protein [Metabacillus idriensis]|uniref:hypothetical protein n=1 Tax=Metabacillus idriensis TaxID=324768 RepID=UPI00174C9CF4|nr:hypothetical protein [Metabacillus idriensis]